MRVAVLVASVVAAAEAFTLPATLDLGARPRFPARCATLRLRAVGERPGTTAVLLTSLFPTRTLGVWGVVCMCGVHAAPVGAHSGRCLPQLLAPKKAAALEQEPKQELAARTAEQSREESLKALEAAERERIALAGVEVPPEKRNAMVDEYWAQAEQQFLDAALAMARRSVDKGSPESSTGLGRRPDPASIQIVDGKVTVKKPSLLKRLFRGSSSKVIPPLCLSSPVFFYACRSRLHMPR
jgi:hypothetical protein